MIRDRVIVDIDKLANVIKINLRNVINDVTPNINGTDDQHGEKQLTFSIPSQTTPDHPKLL
ncbi:hypothetical protein BRLA_c007990 [Brevibacillus laterosporus LMG 15441]|uniref:Uncharacterized protein n=1 Tax=Brevibacillus laterosporus LMG 15441 TaxID=1042163 RepID=A0A075QXQ5_BRELA|nr:hypothetical protein BRLA_c007990 [Brevibacillus laterosporus LMG 15441]